MNKPITITYEEFKNKLADLINYSGLPTFMMEPILQNYLTEIRLAAQKQYQYDKEAYEKSLEIKDNKDEQVTE